MASLFAKFIRVAAKTFTTEVFAAENGHPGFYVDCDLRPSPDRQRMGKQYRLGTANGDGTGFMHDYIVHNVKDWRGLTPENLQRLSTNFLPISEDTRKNLDTQYNGEFPFEEEVLQTLVKFSPLFVDRIMTRLNEVEQDNENVRVEERESAEKNSHAG
jgi:hypothetical protein